MREDLIRSVVDTYKDFCDCANGRNGTICSYALSSLDGKKTAKFGPDVCHSSLRWAVDPNKYDELITSYPIKDEIVDVEFFNFMRDHLYKRFAEFIHLEKTTDGFYYISITNLDKIPANIVFNICICSRIIVEYRKYLSTWWTLREQGVDPALAFILFRSTISKDGRIIDVGSDEEHLPTYLASNVYTILRGLPEGCGWSFKEDPKSCTPCNSIWDTGVQLKNAVGKTIDEIWTEWRANDELLQSS